MRIVGRREEQRQLKSYRESERPEFLVVFGRRRVGKTFLIREYFSGEFGFQCTGLAGADKKAQLAGFNNALNKYGQQEYPLSDNWLTAFSQLIHLLENSAPGKKVVFLDEMPWMDTHKSGFLTGLEHFWNGWGAGRSDLLLIACGSAASWLTKKVFQNRGGLYNRVTRRMHLLPFTLYECEQYFERAGVIFNRHQILEFYMIFGGIPYYLSLFDKSYSLAQNVDLLCFAGGAQLRDEFANLYASLFLHADRHREVVGALCRKNSGLTREEIIKATAFNNGGNLSLVLTELEQSGFIRSYRAFGKKERDKIYQLIDFFSLFYLKFMSPGSTDEHFWSNFSRTGAHNAWSGYAFELVCLCHLAQIKQKLGITGVQTETSTWRSSQSDPGEQIDLVIERGDHAINLCEMKYSAGEFAINKETDRVLRNKRTAFVAETGTKKALLQTMITTYGLKANLYSGNVQSEVSAEDLFAP